MGKRIQKEINLISILNCNDNDLGKLKFISLRGRLQFQKIVAINSMLKSNKESYKIRMNKKIQIVKIKSNSTL